MAHIKKVDDFHKVNESIVKNSDQEILDYAERYGNEALGYAICDLLKNGEYTFPEDLYQLILEYDGNTGKL